MIYLNQNKSTNNLNEKKTIQKTFLYRNLNELCFSFYVKKTVLRNAMNYCINSFCD